jgi:hypothetical protein
MCLQEIHTCARAESHGLCLPASLSLCEHLRFDNPVYECTVAT